MAFASVEPMEPIELVEPIESFRQHVINLAIKDFESFGVKFIGSDQSPFQNMQTLSKIFNIKKTLPIRQEQCAQSSDNCDFYSSKLSVREILQKLSKSDHHEIRLDSSFFAQLFVQYIDQEYFKRSSPPTVILIPFTSPAKFRFISRSGLLDIVTLTTNTTDNTIDNTFRKFFVCATDLLSSTDLLNPKNTFIGLSEQGIMSSALADWLPLVQSDTEFGIMTLTSYKNPIVVNVTM